MASIQRSLTTSFSVRSTWFSGGFLRISSAPMARTATGNSAVPSAMVGETGSVPYSVGGSDGRLRLEVGWPVWRKRSNISSRPLPWRRATYSGTRLPVRCCPPGRVRSPDA
ncbi:Uncharacterised protein [Mycobacteroides abscessus subsp. abscessus]|nr:Uncharacterised protein [Mycobacteroides abscessus subsp. abscessus]